MPTQLDRVAASLGPIIDALDVNAVDRLMGHAGRDSHVTRQALIAAMTLQIDGTSNGATLDAAFTDDQPWSLVNDHADGRIKIRS